MSQREVRPIFLWLAAALLMGACSGEAPEPRPVVPEPRGPAAAPAQPRTRSEGARAPSPGAAPAASAQLAVEVVDGHVSVEAQDALALAVLERLGVRAGFRVAARTETPRRVSLRLEDAPLEQAIAAILAETPYGIDYRYDAARGAHAIETVRVGLQEGSATAAPSDAEPAEPFAEQATSAAASPRGETLPDDTEPIDLSRLLAQRKAVVAESGTQPEVLEALSDPRDEVRAEAVGELDTSGVDLDTAIAFAKADPSPLVRAAAIDALGEDGRYRALTEVMRALDDPDPTVVLRAIAVIDREGDATLVLRLGPLVEHQDNAVRARAAEALEQLNPTAE